MAGTQVKHIVIRPVMEKVIRHMLEEPEGEFYLADIARAIGHPSGSVSPLLNTMLAGKWLAVSRRQGRRKFYRLTQDTPDFLREVLAAD